MTPLTLIADVDHGPASTPSRIKRADFSADSQIMTFQKHGISSLKFSITFDTLREFAFALERFGKQPVAAEFNLKSSVALYQVRHQDNRRTAH